MSAPELQLSGGAHSGPNRDPAGLWYLPEACPYPPAIVDLVSRMIIQARKQHAAKQAGKAPDLRTPISADNWLTMRYAVCETASLTDNDIISRANRYDYGLLPGDKLAEAEHAFRWELLLDRWEMWGKHYASLAPTAAHAAALALLSLRKETAVRTFRLAHLSMLSPTELVASETDYGFLEAAEQTAAVTEEVLRVLSPGLPELVPSG